MMRSGLGYHLCQRFYGVIHSPFIGTECSTAEEIRPGRGFGGEETSLLHSGCVHGSDIGIRTLCARGVNMAVDDHIAVLCPMDTAKTLLIDASVGMSAVLPYMPV